MSDHAGGERPIVIACGLAREARIAAGPGVRAIAGGVDARRLADELARAVARGASGVMSFGVAGALAPELAPGAWVVARGIVTAEGHCPCDPAWTQALRERLSGAHFADLASVDRPVTTLEGKRALAAATRAIAVDTESHIAAAAAARIGIPFAAFRVIADPAARALPRAASVAVRFDGSIDLRAVVSSLVRAPAQLPLLVHAALDARAAFRALLRGRRLLGPGLGFVDLRALDLDVA